MAVLEMTHQQKVQDFLAQKRIAVCGLSRTKDSGAGAIYLKLRNHGYEVFPVHPTAEALHGDTCYPSLSAIPGGVDAVFIMNSPDVSEQIVDEALKLGISRVWMHNNGLMPSSVSDKAVARCREAGVSVIDIGCPMMFLEPDIFHSCMRWVLKARGRLN
jgi:predicted CoA-binding protein